MQLFWILATALVRISVAFSLLRLSRCAGGAEKLWTWCLRGLIGMQLLLSTGWLVFLVFNCRPLRGMWEPVPKLTCWGHKYTVTWGWVANSKSCKDLTFHKSLTGLVIVILMDFILATMPVQLIRTLHRTLREKILICCLMATGLFATGIAGYKMTLSQQANTGDLLATTVKLSLWCKLEEQVGIIAACLPCLKAQIERLLYRIGIIKSRFGQLSTSLISCKIMGHPPGMLRDISTQGVEDLNPNNSDARLGSFATNPDWASGTTTTIKSKSASSRTREVGFAIWDL